MLIKKKRERANLQIFAQADNERTRGDGIKLKEGRFRLDVKKKFLEVRHRNSFPREIVDAPSLELLKTRLDKLLGNLV